MNQLTGFSERMHTIRGTPNLDRKWEGEPDMSWFPRVRMSSGTTSSAQSTVVPHAHRQRKKQIDSLREQVNG